MSGTRPTKSKNWLDTPAGTYTLLAVILIAMIGVPLSVPSSRAALAQQFAPQLSWVHDHRPAALEDIPIQPEGSSRGFSPAEFGPAIKANRAVSLAEAWRSGASSWTRAQRAVFAADPDTLVPPGEDHCAVVNRVVAVKYHYRLSMDAREAAAAQADLDKC